MSASRLLWMCWAALATLSVCTVVLAHSGATAWLSITILLVAVAKAWLITEGFMELRRAPRLWPAAVPACATPALTGAPCRRT